MYTGRELSMDNLQKFLESGEYLPVNMRDFHDQKNLFKSMHFLFRENENTENMPSWINGHIYTIDWFLWFMASRGYTLQKSRKKDVEFKEWPDFRKLMSERSND